MAHDFSPPESVFDHLPGESRAIIARRKSPTPEAVQAFHVYLREQFELIAKAKTWSMPHYWDNHRNAVKHLVQSDLSGLLAWLRPWIAETKRVAQFGLFDQFPIVDVIKELAGPAPKEAMGLYDILSENKRGLGRSTEMRPLLFYLLDTDEARALWNAALATTVFDSDLLMLSTEAHKRERLDWLFSAIELLSSSDRPADVAKAYTLLGFCNPSARAQKIWDVVLKRPVSDAWLRTVLVGSANAYLNNQECQNAYAAFWHAEGGAAALWELSRIKDLADNRILTWSDALTPKRRDARQEQNLMFDIARDGMSKAIKQDTDKRRKMLFHTRLSFSTMRPWS